MKQNDASTCFKVSLLAAAITLAPLAVAQDDDIPELGELEVTAGKEGPQGPDFGYNAQRSLTATKTDTPLSETPRSVSVVTRERVEDQGFQTLSDLLFYVPGVSPAGFPVGDNLMGDVFYIRGMNQRDYGYGTYRDGLRVQPNAYSTSVELYGLERVEVLKGPSAVLYGENAPGGMVNFVSKRPRAERRGEVSLSYGSNRRKQVTADLSGALTDDGKVLGRLVFLGRRADTQVDYVGDDRIYLAPSLSVKLTDRDTLTLLAQYQSDDTAYQIGLPAAGTLLDHPSGEIDRDTVLGHPSWDTFEREVWSLGYEWQHTFSDQWRFEQKARYTRSLIDRRETWWTFPPALPPIPGLLPGGASGDGYDPFVLAYGRDRTNESRVYSFDNQLIGNVRTGGLENTILVGASYDYTSFDQTQYVSERPDLAAMNLGEYRLINIFDPVWADEPQASNLSSASELTQGLAGVYGQWQGKWNGLIALAGARYDYADSEDDTHIPGGSDVSRSDDAFTYQFGLMYQFAGGFSPYLNYSTSFIPVQQAAESNGVTFDPITGDQAEVGIKFQPEGSDSSVTLSAYQLSKDDALVWANGSYRQIGSEESEGVELEWVSDVTESLSVSAQYTYTDAKITDDNGSRYEGRQKQGVPRNAASVWARYEFVDGPANGLLAGLGLRYLGKTYAYAPASVDYGTLEVDAVTQVDAVIGYRFADNWQAQINVQNLFDKEYIGECNNAGRCYYGAERSVLGTLSYNW